jgi:aryl-alcohol dehydrogenase-like predicted oxidoreductase
VSVEELDRAQALTEIVSVQNRFNLQDRDAEDVLDACAERNLAFIPWFPLAAGPLARPGGPVDQIAERHDATPSQIALAWLLHRSPAMLPIPGTSSIDHLEENIGAAEIALSDGDMAELNAAAS